MAVTLTAFGASRKDFSFLETVQWVCSEPTQEGLNTVADIFKSIFY